MTKGMGLNKRVVTILEGESLVNDSSALIAFRFAIAGVGSGTFLFWQAGFNFLLMSLGGIGVGLLMGYLLVLVHKHVIEHSIVSTSLTLVSPFVAYLSAERFHFLGVLAVVTAALYLSWRSSTLFSYQTRIRNKAVWDTLIFILNGFIFILIGLQLPGILADLGQYSVGHLMMYGFTISAVTVVVRMLWVFGGAALPRYRNLSDNAVEEARNTWKNVLIVAWTGTRGIVSLATALALPLTLANGSAFPNRSLILFLACSVIFITLFVQGASLPLLIRLLKVKNVQDHQAEEVQLRLALAKQVVAFIEEDVIFQADEGLKEQLHTQYTELVRILSLPTTVEAPAGWRSPSVPYLLQAQLEIQRFERKLLNRFHRKGTFNQAAIRQVEEELDLLDFQLKRSSQQS